MIQTVKIKDEYTQEETSNKYIDLTKLHEATYDPNIHFSKLSHVRTIAELYNTSENLFYIIEYTIDGFILLPVNYTTNHLYFIHTNRSSCIIPEKIFDKVEEVEVPYGLYEIYNFKNLFKLSQNLKDKIKSIPHNNIHDMLNDFQTGIMDQLDRNEKDWPVMIDIAIDDKSKISYWTIKKIKNLLKSDDNGYTRYFDRSLSLTENLRKPELRKKKAIMSTFGRVFNKLFHYGTYTARQLEEFESLFLIHNLDKIGYFEITNDIHHAYDHDNYNQPHGNGTLGQSCMRHEENQKLLDFYKSLGEDVVQCLVLYNHDDQILGRALLWNKCYNRRRKTHFVVMDRVYTEYNALEIFFHVYAKENGYIRKKLNSYRNNTLIQPNGKGGIGACYVKFDPKNLENREDMNVPYVPWLDTFKFADFDEGYLTTHKNLGGNKICQNTHGSVGHVYGLNPETYEVKMNELNSIHNQKI